MWTKFFILRNSFEKKAYLKNYYLWNDLRINGKEKGSNVEKNAFFRK
jgi:hypothetical protein